ncbi:polysaccharide deacetylase family protein [Blautia sp. HCP3S3_C12]|uniref:polysaccharide deacetylase family protein n=1 Tax=unclassified Blautia TaxID=2648079 RepID=UPI003F8BF93B|nr:polysaccharide deacetylase family protein [Ruminococcus sp.]
MKIHRFLFWIIPVFLCIFLLFCHFYTTTENSLNQTAGRTSVTKVEAPRVALTFDDGPNAKYTPLLLEGLRKRNIHATFFLLGENILKNKELLLRMQKDGHLIGCHTWSHVQLDKISPSRASREILKTNSLIYHITGTYPTCLRPPYGAWKKDLELPVTMLPVFWDVDTLDWQSQNPESILDIVRKNVQDGSIILMHDSYDSSVRAALAIADELTEKGYDFVTADQLLDP